MLMASAAAVPSSSREAFAISNPVRSATIVWKFRRTSRRPCEISDWYGVYCVYQPGIFQDVAPNDRGRDAVVISHPDEGAEDPVPRGKLAHLAKTAYSLCASPISSVHRHPDRGGNRLLNQGIHPVKAQGIRASSGRPPAGGLYAGAQNDPNPGEPFQHCCLMAWLTRLFFLFNVYSGWIQRNTASWRSSPACRLPRISSRLWLMI